MSAPTYLSDDLSSNRFSRLPANRLQLVLFYDGRGEATFGFEYKDPSGTVGWINVPGVPPFDRIMTKEYDLRGCTLTGNFVVEGVVPNGVVDGLAFGLMWRDGDQHYHILRSNAPQPIKTASFVGAWPLGMNHSTFASRAPQLTDWCARETAFAVICGAKLLLDGKYRIDVL
ncbi:MAG: hypothetical protein H6712_26620 [Myxococcales bacterium]|nr:hypothetical protein [Myxococcales bacterium]MCB9717451.1 hypothetical protein [Myxococcales bacterium]